MNFEIPNDLSRLLSKPKFTFKHLKKAVQEFHRKLVIALQIRLLTILWMYEGGTAPTSLRKTLAELKPISTICLMREIDVISEECVTKIYFSYFSTKPYGVGTQKNRLNETVLLSTQNIFK